VDGETFVITPSGKGYDTLTAADIAVLRVKDLAPMADETGAVCAVKPSSEKGIHAACYALRPDVGFVIHTHQFLASLAGLSKEGAIRDAANFWADIVGPEIPIAKYGLPGTGKLKKAVAACLKASEAANAILMARHGALCVGKDSESAFLVAQTLEDVCGRFLAKRFSEKVGVAAEGFADMLASIKAQLQKPDAPDLVPYHSVRSAKAFAMFPAGQGGPAIDVSLQDGQICNGAAEMPDTLALHRSIYQNNKSVNAIRHVKEGALLAYSYKKAKLPAFLDDFAQIAGPKIRSVAYDKTCAAAANPKNKNAVILHGNGAIVTGRNDFEAAAVEMVAQKNAAAALAAPYLKKPKPIGTIDGTLMRFIYVKKYSKKK
jgi:L-fuculose-phosphate aldolase